MTAALHARRRIDEVNGIAFSDGSGRAFGFACTARDAFISNFHCHCVYSLIGLIAFSLSEKHIYPWVD